MKRIFTLLFCVVAVTVAANASERALQCINALMSNEAVTSIKAANLDANHDGVLTIADVTAIIAEEMQKAKQAECAPADELIDVEAIADEAVKSETGEPSLKDVNKAIDHNLKIQKKK